MSVFIRPDSKEAIYSYDFQLGGRRFSGSTGEKTRRAAEQVEKTRRAEAKAQQLAEGALYGKELTLLAATARYWQEIGQHHKNADTTLWSLGWLKDHFGDSTMLHEIDQPKVAAMVAKRRGELVPSQRKKGRAYNTPEVRRRVSPATVNRTVTQPLREIVIRAAKVWKVRVAEIDWSEHLLAEPQERVREATPGEEDRFMAELKRGYDEAVEFTFLNGLRRMEVLGLDWTRVDFFSRRFTVIGKGGRMRSIRMTNRSYEILWAQRGLHPDTVFTFAAARTVRMKDGRLLERGKRYPLTEAGFKTEARRAIERAGVKNFHFHDIRHTTATRVLRKSNLRVVQQLLGHADVKTTTKYAHVMDEDVLNALEAASPTKTPTMARGTEAKALKSWGKKG